MFGCKLIYAILKVGWGETGKPLKGPDKMGLVVIVVINVRFEALQVSAGGVCLVKLLESYYFGQVFSPCTQTLRKFHMQPA